MTYHINRNPESNESNESNETDIQGETDIQTEFYVINPSKNAALYKEKLAYLDSLLGMVPIVHSINHPMYIRLRSIYILLLKLEAELPITYSMVLSDRLPLEELKKLTAKIEMLNDMKANLHEKFGFVPVESMIESYSID